MIPHLDSNIKQWHLYFVCFRSQPFVTFWSKLLLCFTRGFTWSRASLERGPTSRLGGISSIPWTGVSIWDVSLGIGIQSFLDLAHIKQTTIQIKWHLHETVLPLLQTWSTSAGYGKPGTGIVSRSAWSAFQGEDTGICLLAHVEAAGKISVEPESFFLRCKLEKGLLVRIWGTHRTMWALPR